MRNKKFLKKVIVRNEDSGITLVALVVTIIALLILAGVTISLVLNNNGIMDRATHASNIWANATKNETTMFAEIDQQIEMLSNVGNNLGKPGLYDSNGVLIVDWETLTSEPYNLNLEKDFRLYMYRTPYREYDDGNHMKCVLSKLVENGVISSDTLIFLNIPEGVTRIGYTAVFLCPEIIGVSLPRSLVEIGSDAFMDCIGLKKITIHPEITTLEDGCFSGCTNLEEVHLENGLITIGGATFAGCLSLERISIPSSVVNVGSRPFGGCSNLKSIAIEEGSSLHVPVDIWRGDHTNLTVTIGNEEVEDSKSTVTFPYGQEVGQDVTIGEERFRILKKSTDGKTITAMPYYNLVLNSTPIKQATENNYSSAGTIAFAPGSNPTWETDKNIDIDDTITYPNNVKTPIASYEAYLQELGANNVKARIGRLYSPTQEGPAITEAEYLGDLHDGDTINPSGKGYFWIGSSGDANFVVNVFPNSNLVFSSFNGNFTGVRPLLVISLP